MRLAIGCILLFWLSTIQPVALADGAPIELAEANLDDLAFQEVAVGGARLKVTAAGSGCQPGTWTVHEGTSPNGLMINFKDYMVAVGPDYPDPTPTLFCNVRVELSSPTPARFKLTRYRYKGSANLDTGVSASLATAYWFSGIGPAAPDVVAEHIIPGPYARVFDVRDDLTTGSPNRLVSSSCATSATLILESRVTLSPTQSPKNGFLEMQSIQGTPDGIEIDIKSDPCAALTR